jgi:hypothetical protein
LAHWGRPASDNALTRTPDSSRFPARRSGGRGVVVDELALVPAWLDPRSTWPSPAATSLIGLAGDVRVNPTFACEGHVALRCRMSGVPIFHAVQRGLLVGRCSLTVFRMTIVRRLQDRPLGLNDRLPTAGRRSGRGLVLERDSDRGDVGLGPADSFGNGLEAIAVLVGVDGRPRIEVRLLTGSGQRDVCALASGVR